MMRDVSSLVTAMGPVVDFATSIQDDAGSAMNSFAANGMRGYSPLGESFGMPQSLLIRDSLFRGDEFGRIVDCKTKSYFTQTGTLDSGAAVYSELVFEPGVHVELVSQMGCQYLMGFDATTKRQVFSIGPLQAVADHKTDEVLKGSQRQLLIDRFSSGDASQTLEHLRHVFFESKEESEVKAALQAVQDDERLDTMSTLVAWMDVMGHRVSFDWDGSIGIIGGYSGDLVVRSLYGNRFSDSLDKCRANLLLQFFKDFIAGIRDKSAIMKLATDASLPETLRLYVMLIQHDERGILSKSEYISCAKDFIENRDNDEVFRYYLLNSLENLDKAYVRDHYYNAMLGEDFQEMDLEDACLFALHERLMDTGYVGIDVKKYDERLVATYRKRLADMKNGCFGLVQFCFLVSHSKTSLASADLVLDVLLKIKTMTEVEEEVSYLNEALSDIHVNHSGALDYKIKAVFARALQHYSGDWAADQLRACYRKCFGEEL